ncbi:MAG: hypothetical protein K2J82_03680 [Muribaculaceae bacterium]|nr:hypothetical protein [Muribaculaceae bacterium]MDE6753694.1 hypothetical protein [Muribaculaceae bacterium]
MKTYSYIFPLLTVLIFPLTGCNGNSGKSKISRPDLPKEVRPVAEAIVNESPEEFASAVSYPIERPYPLKNVEDSASMVAYYPNLIDEPLKKAVTETPDSAWQQEGWRGWTLDNGSYFWIDEGKIYSMTYVSKKETQMLDSLQHLEISSLEPSLQPNWIPVACVVDSVSGAIFRIDTKADSEPAVYRLAGYSDGSDLSGAPTVVLYGSLELEGSMGNRFYHFSDENGTTALYTPDISDDEAVPEIEIDKKGKSKRYGARPAYWLDHVKKDKRK